MHEMNSYSPSMYEEIEKYAADLEITCDYYIQEFQVQQQHQPRRKTSILNDFQDSSQTGLFYNKIVTKRDIAPAFFV